MKQLRKIYYVILAFLPFIILSCSEDDSFNPVSIDTYTDEVINFEEIDPDFAEDNELQATFRPLAANAVEFDVFFGDMANEIPVTIKAGDSVVHTYPARGAYTVRYIGKSASGKTAETSKSISIGLLAPFELKFDESDLSKFFTFGGVEFEILDNPFKQGTNEDDTKVGEYKKPNAAFVGIGYQSLDDADNLETLIDFAGVNKKVELKVYSTTAVPVALIFQEGTGGERGVEANASHMGTGWETLTFDYNEAKLEFVGPTDPDNGKPTIATARYRKFVLFVNGPGDVAGTFYVDDLMQEAL